MFDDETIGLPEERPRERLYARGPSALSLSELLALLIGTGTATTSSLALAQALLEEAGGADGLARHDAWQIARRHGLGQAKAARIVAALELGRRVASAERTGERLTIEAAARRVGPELSAAREERFVVLLLDRRQRLMRTATIYQGTVDGLQIRAREVFRPAIEAGAGSMIVAHNHPSGDPTPSEPDRLTTRQLVHAGHILGVELREHLVIGGACYAAIQAGRSGRWDSDR